MPYANEHSCRLLDPGGLEIVGSGEREHRGRAYRVIYGRPEGGDGSVEQAYRYPVDSWSESKAGEHCQGHGGFFEPAERDASVELRFWAAIQSLSGDGRLAIFYLMDTSLNRNNWRVTGEALEEALPSLIGKPLGCIPGYRVDHVFEPLRVGKWVDAEEQDGHAIATAEVTDEVAWERLKDGDWGPVSVVIDARRVRCSVCGQDVTGGPDQHVVDGQGHEVIESFDFRRVDFVSEPAYPQAGMVSMGRLAGATSPGVIDSSRSFMDGAQGPQGASPEPEENMEKQEMEAQVEELRAELGTLKSENAELKAKNQELETKVERIEAERHDELVDTALGARLEAGLVPDREAEAERLKELDDGVLVFLREDAEMVAEKIASKPAGPRTKYTADDKSTFDSAIEDARERLFGHRRSE
jgi:hypothetical protein